MMQSYQPEGAISDHTRRVRPFVFRRHDRPSRVRTTRPSTTPSPRSSAARATSAGSSHLRLAGPRPPRSPSRRAGRARPPTGTRASAACGPTRSTQRVADGRRSASTGGAPSDGEHPVEALGRAAPGRPDRRRRRHQAATPGHRHDRSRRLRIRMPARTSSTCVGHGARAAASPAEVRSVWPAGQVGQQRGAAAAGRARRTRRRAAARRRRRPLGRPAGARPGAAPAPATAARPARRGCGPAGRRASSSSSSRCGPDQAHARAARRRAAAAGQRGGQAAVPCSQAGS